MPVASFTFEFVDDSGEYIDPDEAYKRWDVAYQLKEAERLRQCYASHLRELEFYQAWRREDPQTQWEPELFVDEGKADTVSDLVPAPELNFSMCRGEKVSCHTTCE